LEIREEERDSRREGAARGSTLTENGGRQGRGAKDSQKERYAAGRSVKTGTRAKKDQHGERRRQELRMGDERTGATGFGVGDSGLAGEKTGLGTRDSGLAEKKSWPDGPKNEKIGQTNLTSLLESST